MIPSSGGVVFIGVGIGAKLLDRYWRPLLQKKF